MPLSWLPALRIVVLVAAVTAVLQATILNGWVQRTVFDRWVAFGERMTQSPARGRFPDPRLARIFPLVMAAVFLALWWYLGTAAGVKWAGAHLGRHP